MRIGRIDTQSQRFRRYRGVVIAALSVALGQGGEAFSSPPSLFTEALEREYSVTRLEGVVSGAVSMVVTPPLSQMKSLPTDPKYGWQFVVACYGYLQLESTNRPELRLRVYAQHLDDLPAAQSVCRLLLRLQEVAWHRLRLQVNLQGERILNVWLCRQGNPGGEQWRNNLYLYAIQEIRHPLEWLRETAHELSHALIPGVTGFVAPEPWANGYIGERLFFIWLEALLSEGKLSREDIAGASADDVRRFVQQRCLPLRQSWVQGGFPDSEFRRTDSAGMSALIGLVLYIDGVYGSSMLRATFARLAEPYPTALWKAFAEAVSEAESLHLTPLHPSTRVWLPAGVWKVLADDNTARLERGKEQWSAKQPIWRLSQSGWYLLRSAKPLYLRR